MITVEPIAGQGAILLRPDRISQHLMCPVTGRPSCGLYFISILLLVNHHFQIFLDMEEASAKLCCAGRKFPRIPNALRRPGLRQPCGSGGPVPFAGPGGMVQAAACCV